jgi:exonuclease III
MKIVSWNCHFGFSAEKNEFIKKYKADLYIIQECAEDDFNGLFKISKNYDFFCDNIDSKYGVGIFSDKLNIEILPEHNKDFRYIVPYRIFNSENEFVLFSVWTKDKDKNNNKIEYTEQTWKAINYDGYKKYLSKSAILIGDFNSNNYWNRQYLANKSHTHNEIIANLKNYGIVSAYHEYYNVENGNENDPTLLWKMDIQNKFHIDYAFVSNKFTIKSITVGSLSEWKENKLSDHCPLIMELE